MDDKISSASSLISEESSLSVLLTPLLVPLLSLGELNMSSTLIFGFGVDGLEEGTESNISSILKLGFDAAFEGVAGNSFEGVAGNAFEGV